MEAGDLLVSKQQEILARRNQERLGAQSSLPGIALLWTALGPGWTASLARVAGFPSGSLDAGGLLDTIAAQGLTNKLAASPELYLDPVTGKAKLTTAEDLYSSGVQAVREIIETTTEASERDQKVRDCIRNIAAGLRGAQTQGTVLPDRIVKWLELAERININARPSAKDYLLQQVDQALAQNDEVLALAWVESAFPLEKALEGSIALAVRLAGLRVQLHQRRAGNERFLKRFLRRETQAQAFEKLLSGPDTLWALHYAGSGGVGKTMLVRYLESRAAPQANVITARVDFDYLNPEYPTTKPALLLVQLAGELRLADSTGQAATYFQSFFDKAQTLHERIGGQTQPVNAPLVDSPEFQGLLDMFGWAIERLGRVVLILDTCEELAKMKSDGSPQAGVEMTFKILEGLHERVPSLRVVFCGRRPLASAGFGWACLKDSDRSLPARLYLQLHEIRAFNAAEAENYLSGLAECPPDLIEPILPHCVENDHTPLFSTGARHGTETRYNPFELALYAAWAREKPPPRRDEVAATTLDQYVRTRIVGRIENRELTAILPAIVWMADVDSKAMAYFTGLTEDDDRVVQLTVEMQRQEWVEDGHGAGFLVPGGMRTRLLDYYATNDLPAYHEGRTRAAAHLEGLSASTPLRQMSVVHLEAAMVALQPEPERADQWWEALEEKILEENAWDWILTPARRLLAEEHWPKAVLQGKHIRSRVAATLAAGQIHTFDMQGAQETSSLIEADAPNHPNKRTGMQLGLIARSLRSEIVMPAAELFTAETHSAVLSGVEWVLENPASERHYTAVDLEDWLGRLSYLRGSDPGLEAFGWMLAGRAFAEQDLAVLDDSARRCFQYAFAMASLVGASENPRYRFWHPPADLRSRVNMELLRWAWPRDASPTQLDWWIETPQIRDVDSDRLASALLALKSVQRVPGLAPDNALQDIAVSLALSRSEPRLLSVHRSFEPYFAVAARELAWAGHVELALERLQTHSSDSEDAGVAFSETLSADRARTAIENQFRLTDTGATANESLAHSEDLADQALAMAQNSLLGNSVFPSDNFGGPVEKNWRWLTSIALDSGYALLLLGWARVAFDSMPAQPASFADFSCRLNLHEADELAAAFSLEAPSAPREGPQEPQLPLGPVEAFIIRLRMWSLDLAPEPETEMANRIGVRRAGEIALQIGELLALRLPRRSVPMLQFAGRSFHACGDVMREMMACACLGLAQVRANQNQGVHEAADRLKTLFEREVNALVNPATWKYAEAAMQPAGDFELQGPAVWMRPWILRVALCAALARDGGSPGALCDNVLRAWRRTGRPLPPESLVGLRPERHDTLGLRKFGALPPILKIECVDKAGRPAAGTRVRISQRDEIVEVVTPAITAPYRELTEIAELLQQFSSIHSWVVDRGAAWVSWEAILDPSGVQMYSRRTIDKEVPVPNLMNWVEPTFHTLTFHHAGGDLGGTAFGGTQRWTYTNNPENLAVSMPPGKIQILHVVSDVLETSGGARLSFRGEGESDRGRVFRAEDLPRMLPDIRLYILQLPVGLNDGKRDGVCREKAGLLRSFAAQLQLASRQIVITLPGCRFREGTMLLESIAAGVAKPEPTAAVSIFGQLKESRARLFQSLPPDESEAGFDICYFG